MWIIQDYLIGEFDYGPALSKVPYGVLCRSVVKSCEAHPWIVTRTQLRFPPPLSGHTSIMFVLISDAKDSPVDMNMVCLTALQSIWQRGTF